MSITGTMVFGHMGSKYSPPPAIPFTQMPVTQPVLEYVSAEPLLKRLGLRLAELGERGAG